MIESSRPSDRTILVFRQEWPTIAAEAVATGAVALDFLQHAGDTVVVPPGWYTPFWGMALQPVLPFIRY